MVSLKSSAISRGGQRGETLKKSAPHHLNTLKREKMNYQNAQFHISVPCLDTNKTSQFYTKTLGFEMGRFGENWVDINLFGNQITFIEMSKALPTEQSYSFGGSTIPAFHIGVMVNNKTWNQIYEMNQDKAHMKIDRTIFLEGKAGEHRSFFLEDPNGYLLEFKCFSEPGEVFSGAGTA